MRPRLRPQLLLAALALLGTAPPLASQAAAASGPIVVREGMTEAEVVDAMGAPDVVRRVNEWSYLFYPNGCPILCGSDDVVVLRGCRVVGALLRRPAKAIFVGPPLRTGFGSPMAGDCASPSGPVEARDTRPWTPGPGRLDSLQVRQDPPAAGPAIEGRARTDSPAVVFTPADTVVRPGRVTGMLSDSLATGRNAPPAPDNRYRLPEVIFDDVVRPGPAGSISTPTAFGVDWGEAFAGVGLQGRSRYTDDVDAALVIGGGIGSRQLLAAEVALTSYSTFRDGGPGETGGVSVKVHHTFNEDFAVAAGVENLVNWGGSDAGTSHFGVVSRVFRRGPDPDAPASAVAVSLGVGDGRFRSEQDIIDDEDGVNVFGSVGVRWREWMSTIADWTGQDLNVGVSFTPWPRFPFVVTPGLADLTGNAGDGVRFILSTGYAVRFGGPRFRD